MSIYEALAVDRPQPWRIARDATVAVALPGYTTEDGAAFMAIRPETVLALVAVAEAAHELQSVVAQPPRGMFPQADKLDDALRKFDFTGKP